MIWRGSLSYRRFYRPDIGNFDCDRSHKIGPYLLVSASIDKSFHRTIFDYLPTLCIGFPGIQIIRHLYLDNDRRFIDSWPYLNRQRYQVLVHCLHSLPLEKYKVTPSENLANLRQVFWREGLRL